MTISQTCCRFMCLLLQSTFPARDTTKQTEHRRGFWSRSSLQSEESTAASLAHAGTVVDCGTRPHCSTLNLPSADTSSVGGFSLLARVQWRQPVPVLEQYQWDQ